MHDVNIEISEWRHLKLYVATNRHGSDRDEKGDDVHTFFVMARPVTVCATTLMLLMKSS